MCKCGHAPSRIGSSSSGSKGVSRDLVGSGRKMFADTFTSISEGALTKSWKWKGIRDHGHNFRHNMFGKRLFRAVNIVHKFQQSLRFRVVMQSWPTFAPSTENLAWRLISLSRSFPAPSEKSQITAHNLNLRTKRFALSLAGTSAKLHRFSITCMQTESLTGLTFERW